MSQCAAHSLTHSLHLSLSFTLSLVEGLARLLREGVHCFWCLMTTTTMATTAMATCKRPNDGVNEKFALETDDHMRLLCGMRMQRLLTENRRAALDISISARHEVQHSRPHYAHVPPSPSPSSLPQDFISMAINYANANRVWGRGWALQATGCSSSRAAVGHNASHLPTAFQTQ